jgi:hypothetical protein
MRRWHEEKLRTEHEWRKHVELLRSFNVLDVPPKGRFRKRKAFGSNRPQRDPRRIPTVQERLANELDETR